jgi:hypothetical protein
MQRERDRTTLGIALLVAAAAVIGKAYPLISVPLIMLAVFFIAWGRDQRSLEAFVGRMPAGHYLLKALNQLDLIISPKDEQRAKKLLHQCWIEMCDLFEESVSEEDIDQFKKRYDETLTNQAIRIENEVGIVARVKFLDQIGINSVRFHKARDNKDYNEILMRIQRTKENLEELIKTEVWNQATN